MNAVSATRSRLPDWPLWGIAMAVALAISIALVGSGIVSVIALAIGRLAGIDVGDGSPGVKLAATFVMDAAMIGSVFITARLIDGKLRLAGFGFAPLAVSRKAATGLGVAAWLSFLGFTAAWTALVGKSGKQTILDDLGIDQSAWLWVGTVILVTVAAPLAEEILFRGFLLSSLWKRMPLVFAAAISGALFGALHLGGSPALLTVPLGVLGFLLCVLRAVTGSLVPCIVVHSINHTLAFGFGEKLAAGWVLLLLVAAVAITTAIALGLSRRAYTPDDGESAEPPFAPIEGGDDPPRGVPPHGLG